MILLSIRLCELTGITIERLCGKSQKADLCEIRCLWWKLVREKGGCPYAYIGLLCNRDHSTVFSGIARINGLLECGDTRVLEVWEKIKDLEVIKKKK